MGGNDVLRIAANRLGSADEIGFMLRQKLEHGGQHARLIEPLTQNVGRQAGQRQQTLRALRIVQHPAKRGQSQCVRVAFSGSMAGNRSGIANNWQILLSFVWEGLQGEVTSVANRILVVEDNDLNRKLFCAVLTANGHMVEPVADGKLVLDAAHSFAPDLVIMDIQLPNVSGIDLIARIKKDRVLTATPILAVTAYAGKGDEDQIRAAGATGYLSKPVSIGPFMAAVNALLPVPV